VLSAIITRIRGKTGAIALVPSYDTHEKTWNPPMPLLFQRAISGERRPISDGALREILQRALASTGIRGHDGPATDLHPPRLPQDLRHRRQNERSCIRCNIPRKA